MRFPKGVRPQHWRWLRRGAVVISIVAGVAKVVAIVHEWHHQPQTKPGVERAHALPEVEAPAACTTPPPADS